MEIIIALIMSLTNCDEQTAITKFTSLDAQTKTELLDDAKDGIFEGEYEAF